jgi:hypothetical protein
VSRASQGLAARLGERLLVDPEDGGDATLLFDPRFGELLSCVGSLDQQPTEDPGSTLPREEIEQPERIPIGGPD